MELIYLVVNSNAKLNNIPSFGFKDYRYATVAVRLDLNSNIHRFYLDIKYTMSFINRKFL